MDHVECKIVNKDGAVLPIGEAGEICVRGFLIIPYYWSDPKKTAEVCKISSALSFFCFSDAQ